LFDQIRRGELRSVKLGVARVILADNLRAWLAAAGEPQR